MIVKYIRYSSVSQKADRQLLSETKYDKIYIEQASGTIPFSERKEGARIIADIVNGKINIDNAENMPEGTEIFIKDNLTGIIYDISKNAFEIELTAGKHTDRFVITFKTQIQHSILIILS